MLLPKGGDRIVVRVLIGRQIKEGHIVMRLARFSYALPAG